ncbi:MAG TPA: AI-2E family transporter [Gaiellaceae bacterium]|nr:AI-2E family transporter [Gaiellaceae bacterium]
MSLDSTGVPRSLRLAASLSWRFLVVAAAVVVLALLVVRLRIVVLPVFAAILLATVLVPPANQLAARGWPRALASLTVLLAALAILAGVIVALAPSVIGELGDLDLGVRGGVTEMEDWLSEGPLGLSETRADELIQRAQEELEANAGRIVGGALGGAIIAIEAVAGGLLTLVLLFFFVRDGARLWEAIVSIAPEESQDDLREIGARSWDTLGGYIRGTTIVALFDAVFIGLALWILGVPLVLPLALLTFFGAYIPIAGAVAAGFAAAMVALVSEGFVAALIVTGAVIVVQQIESEVLQPLVVGRSVELHPVAILLAVTAGGVLWGIPGALVAVPVAAVAARAGGYLRERPKVTAVRAGPPPVSAEE